MTDKTRATGAGVPAAQLDAILLAMHLRQRAKLTATGNTDALSQNAANVLVAQYDRIAELEALQAASPAPAAVAVPDGFALVPKRLTRAMKRVLSADEGGWQWEDLLAAAEAITEQEYAALAAAPAQAVAVPIELRGVKETVEQGGGFWRSCTGCHELNEGHATGPVSKVFGCALGNGCSECGGIGAVWDDTDYDAMADAMAAPAQEHATQLAGQGAISAEPDAWAAVVFGGKRNGKIYSTCDTKPQCESYIGVVEQSNDSITLVARPVFLGAAPAQAQEDARDADGDKALLDFLRDTCCDLRSIDVPTGGDDSDVHWRVIEHCMGELREREIGRSWSDDPRDAIRAAIAAQAKGGA